MFERLFRFLAARRSVEPEQRRERRLPTSASATIVPMSDDDLGNAQIRITDVSSTGICILIHHPMTIGGEFVLNLPEDGPEKAAALRYFVRTCTSVADGLWRIGAEICSIDATGPCMLSIGAREYN